MGWLPQSKFDELRRKAQEVPAEKRESMTWDEARQYIATDTLEMAAFHGARERNQMKPWEVVARLRHIEE